MPWDITKEFPTFFFFEGTKKTLPKEQFCFVGDEHSLFEVNRAEHDVESISWSLDQE